MVRPTLEYLEERLCPTDLTFNIIPIDLTHLGASGIFVPQAVALYIAGQAFRGNPQYNDPRNLYVVRVTPDVFTGSTSYPPVTTVREIYPLMGGGSVPVVLEPSTIPLYSDGLLWEIASINMGWWYGDQPGIVNRNLLTPGPQYGETFTPPSIFNALVAAADGDPYWWF